jgi:hypothetical protein
MPEVLSPYPGIRSWETENGAEVWRLHYESDPAKGIGVRAHVDEINLDLSPWALADYTNARDKALWVQEVEIDFAATQGARVFYYDHAATMVTSKQMEADGIWPIPQTWTRWQGLDPHPRVPHAFLWCAVDPWGDRWYYREYWPSKIYGRPGNPPEDDNRVLIKQYVQLVHFLESAENPENSGQEENIYRRVIDYSARAFGVATHDNERPVKEDEDNYQETYEKLSREVGKETGWRMKFVDCKKDHKSGIALVNEGLRAREIEKDGNWIKRSRIHVVIDKCPELEYQMRTNRYPKLTPIQADKMDPIADPIQKRRHQTDNMRYIENDKPRFIKQETVRSDWRPMHRGVAY